MNRRAARMAAGGLGSFLVATAVARVEPGRRERVLARAANRTAERVSWLPRAPAVLGSPATLPALAAWAAWTGRPQLTLAALLAIPVEKALEVGAKKATGHRRPAHELTDVVPAGSVDVDTETYPSGHVAIAACAAILVHPHVPGRWAAALPPAVALVGYSRIHQGAHFPRDVVGGLCLGVGVAGAASGAAGHACSPDRVRRAHG